MEEIKVFGLGGLDENGKNMYIVEVDKDIFVFEAGLKYPTDSSQLGVEKIIPDFSYLIDNKDRVKAVFITHGHHDVMGALTNLLKVIDVDIYATALTSFMIKNFFKKEKMPTPVIHKIKRDYNFKVGKHHFQTFGVTNSIPDAYGIALDTQYGQIVFTSEYMLDFDLIGKNSDFNIADLAELSKSGVLMIINESVGANRVGHTSPNHKLIPHIESRFDNDKRVLITLYNQNLYHVMEVLELAKKYNKKVFIFDKILLDTLKELDKLGYYSVDPDLLIDKKHFDNNQKDVVVIISGIGSAVFQIMHKIVTKENDFIELNRDDSVIIATQPIPGTEKVSIKMENDLFKETDDVLRISPKVIYSMHASSEDIKMMYSVLKPKYVVPVKGEYRRLLANANIAVEMGYTPDKIILLDNGQIAKFNNGHLVSTKDFIKLTDSLIDGNKELDETGMVIKDREILSTDGVIICGVTIDYHTKKIIGGPDVQTRGVIYLKEADYILKALSDIMTDTINNAVAAKKYSNSDCRFEARDKMIKYMNRETRKRPMVLTTIVEIR